MVTLPMELVEDMLLRLPATDLVRFRLLSKPCFSLIDSPEFVASHLTRTLETGDHLMILLHGPRVLRTAYLDSPEKVSDVDHPLQADGSTEVFGSCNGLVGLVNSPGDLAIFNPSTRQIHQLPFEPVDFPQETIFPKDLFYGLGYDSVNDDYKVVRIVQSLRDDYEVVRNVECTGDDYKAVRIFQSKRDQSQNRFRVRLEVKVYSLKKNSWKEIYLSFERQVQFVLSYYELLYRRRNGVLASNSLHWILPRMRGGNNAFNHITRFDLATEEVGLVSFPLELRAVDDMDLGVLDGLLCLICYVPLSHVDVWVLTEYKGFSSTAWTKLFTVPKPEDVESLEFLRPLKYSKDKAKVLMEINNVQNLMWFDLESQSFTRVEIKDCDGPYNAEIVMTNLVMGCKGKLPEKD